jgi:hypothetical protein
MGGKLRSGQLDRAVAVLAKRQHGVVARRQLVALGLGQDAIDHRLRCGRLHHLHRGIYAVGHPVLSAAGRWMAAVLACGDGAVLSHRSAAALWEIRPSSAPRIDVTVPRHLHARPGIHPHHGRLPPDEVTTHRGIPVTTPPRTLLDLATVLDPRRVERAVQEAEVQRLSDSLSLEDLLTRYPRRPGRATLMAILNSAALGATTTRSELEDRFLTFLDAALLPRPCVNATVELHTGSVEVDCLWERQRVIAELDGHASHGTTAAYERDRARDRALSAAGWRVVRITWRQLHDDGAAVARDLDALLGRSSCTPVPPPGV